MSFDASSTFGIPMLAYFAVRTDLSFTLRLDRLSDDVDPSYFVVAKEGIVVAGKKMYFGIIQTRHLE